MLPRFQSQSYSDPLAQADEQYGTSMVLEMGDRVDRATFGAGFERANTFYRYQSRRRRMNDRAVIENPLAHLSDETLAEDVKLFANECLPSVDSEKLLRAARVAKDIKTYDAIARDPNPHPDLPVQLTEEEKRALVAEKDALFSERGMLLVILTVSLAGFLQGHVQSSINGATLFASELGLRVYQNNTSSITDSGRDDWRLGATNASPFLFAALVGCPLALPINDLVGRRGAMVVAAVLILASSFGAAWVTQWYQLLAVRLVNGLGMGIKAVSTPILASETAVGFWRGSSILAWQLWVAFGIMVGFALNLVFLTAPTQHLSFQLILGAPVVPAVILLVGLWFCPESPRYHMRLRSLSYNPDKAFQILKRLRNTELQALRDVYLVYKSIEQEQLVTVYDSHNKTNFVPVNAIQRIRRYLSQTKDLFVERRLRNALISSSTVALAQQLCGINILAFYSGTLFTGGGVVGHKVAMEYSLGFGAVNFLFGLPAIRTIDTLGRRKWLVLTLPIMSLFLAAAAASFSIKSPGTSIGIVALFLYLHAAAYSPGLGPIPFTLASESFPLSHREAGCAIAIGVNLLFAGLLSMFFPTIIHTMGNGGALAFFAGLNLLAFFLVFLLVEETKRRSLEDLDWIFAVPKVKFIRYQVTTYAPWFFQRYLLRKKVEKHSLYEDRIWGRNMPSPLDFERQQTQYDTHAKDQHPEMVEDVNLPGRPLDGNPQQLDNDDDEEEDDDDSIHA